MPLAGGITKSALEDKWHLQTDQNFWPGAHPSGFEDLVTPAVQAFLAKLNELAREYLKEFDARSGREPNYEDLFSLAQQAVQTMGNYAPNLAVAEFVRRLDVETRSIHTSFAHGPTGLSGLEGLADTACLFLHWVVHHTLGATKPPIGLDAITETARRVDALDVFSLNHDLLIEAQCRAAGVPFEEGFAGRRGDVRAFSGWPDEKRELVRLFKLHGSVDWFLYDFPGWSRQFAIPDHDAFHSRDQHGQLLRPVAWRSAFLSGTIVKEQPYGVGFFGDVFAAFRRHLSFHRHLIVSGYGWGDSGINARLLQWFHDDLQGRSQFIVLHRGASSDLLKRLPRWLRTAHERGRLVHVPKWLQDCNVDDLIPFIDP